VDLELAPEVTLDYANCTPLGLFAERLLVLHGPEGWEAEVSIDKQVLHATIPDGDEVVCHECGPVIVVLINSDLAMRTWWVDDTLVLGPLFVGETLEDVLCKKGTTRYAVIAADGKLSYKKKAVTPTKPTAPKLATWHRAAVCDEPLDNASDWKRIDRPRDVDRLGLPYGYVWYRVELKLPRAARKHLFLPDCADRATIFVNGKRLGVWGVGPDGLRKPIPVALKRGQNVITALVDNLGRLNFGPDIGELKGIYGPIYDAAPLPARKFSIQADQAFSRRWVPRHKAHLIADLEAGPITAAQTDISMRKITPLHVAFNGPTCPVALLCNDKPVGLFERGFGQVTLGPELKSGKNALRFLFWSTDVSAKLLAGFKFHQLNEDVTQGGSWSFRPWLLPEEGARVVGKGLPAWYATKFKAPHRDVPLFLHIIGAKKGQIFLNGKNVGRFWTIGPQQHYYLPECWLEDVNELLLFSESGDNPAGSQLLYCPQGPFNS